MPFSFFSPPVPQKHLESTAAFIYILKDLIGRISFRWGRNLVSNIIYFDGEMMTSTGWEVSISIVCCCEYLTEEGMLIKLVRFFFLEGPD